MARIALEHGLNANLLRRWVQEHVAGPTVAESDAAEPARFIPLPAPVSHQQATPSIRIEINRGATRVVVEWPVEAAGQCNAWLRDLLR